MSNDEADPNVRGWFVRHGLPYTFRIAEELENFGVDCVEHLKLVPPEVRENLFTEDKPIVKTLASLAWKELGGNEDFLFSRTVAFQKNKWNVGAMRRNGRRKKKGDIKAGDSDNAQPGRINYHSDLDSLPDDGSFADEFKEISNENNVGGGPVYEEKYTDEMRGYLEKVAKHWVKGGHQDNQSRLCLGEALTEGKCQQSDIAGYIRRHIYSTYDDPWNGIKRDDKKYKAIYSTISRISLGVKSGKMDDIINANDEERALFLKSKSVTPGARGGQNKRKRPASPTSSV